MADGGDDDFDDHRYEESDGDYEMYEMEIPSDGEYIDEEGVRHIGAMQKSNIDARMNALPPKMDEDDGGYKTGPKGVLADYKRAQKNVAKQRMRDRIQKERNINREITGGVTYDAGSMMNAAPPPHMMPNPNSAPPKEVQKAKLHGDSENEDGSSDLDDSDDEAFQLYKMKSMALITNSMPSFGTYERVDFNEFAVNVKKINENTFVVCHLYENHIEACTRLNFAFEALAPMFEHVKFVRLRAKEAYRGYADAGLPTLLIYKAGEQIQSYIRVTDALGHKFTDKAVAEFLGKEGILMMPSVWVDRSHTRDTDGNSSDE